VKGGGVHVGFHRAVEAGAWLSLLPGGGEGGQLTNDEAGEGMLGGALFLFGFISEPGFGKDKLPSLPNSL